MDKKQQMEDLLNQAAEIAREVNPDVAVTLYALLGAICLGAERVFTDFSTQIAQMTVDAAQRHNGSVN